MTDLIAEYERHLRLLGRAEATVHSYIHETLRRMDRELPAGLLAALPQELEAWLYNAAWSAATRRQRRAAVVGFYAFAADPGRRRRLDYNPAAGLPPVRGTGRRRRPAPTEVVAHAVTRAAQPYRTWFTLAAFAGARCSEIAGLDREDITEREVLLHGKGGKWRPVPTHELVWQAVRGLPPGPVATMPAGRRASRQDVSRLGNWHLARIGGQAVTMHRLRHWFGTQAYEVSGHDIRAVQELLGHASVATTQVYIEASQAGKARAVAGLAVSR